LQSISRPPEGLHWSLFDNSNILEDGISKNKPKDQGHSEAKTFILCGLQDIDKTASPWN